MATFDVTVPIDLGTQSDGTTGAVGTLSWALAQANASPGPHTINIHVDVALAGPLSPIFNSVTINGNDHTIVAHLTRIFMVGVDLGTMNDPRWAGSIIAERPQVAINDLTLANGLSQGGNGVDGGGGGLGAGGALFVNQSADVTLTDVSFSGNQALGGGGGAGDGGGLGGSGAFHGGGGGGIFGNGGGGSGVPGTGGFLPEGGGGGGGIFGNGAAVDSSAGDESGGGGGGYSGDGGGIGSGGGSGGLAISGLNGNGGNGG